MPALRSGLGCKQHHGGRLRQEGGGLRQRGSHPANLRLHPRPHGEGVHRGRHQPQRAVSGLWQLRPVSIVVSQMIYRRCCDICQLKKTPQSPFIIVISDNSVVFLFLMIHSGCGCSTGLPGEECGTRPSPKRSSTSTPSPAWPGRKTDHASAL